MKVSTSLPIAILLFTLVFAGCTKTIQITKSLDNKPAIFPDYTDVVIPVNIAPLNFRLAPGEGEACAFFESEHNRLEVRTKNGKFNIPLSGWKKLLDASKGKEISVTVCVKDGNEWTAYAPFSIQVANEPVDPYIAYRLIEPGYTLWNRMGIYQRNLEGFKETPVLENKMTGNSCMNCHSFCMQNPGRMLFHIRQNYSGTYLTDGDKIEKLITQTDRTISSLVYPSWHPSGRYVAFSVNDTKQSFHINNSNRIEVYDLASDVVIYDTETYELLTTPPLFSKNAFETFPTFSPDGRTLYYCSAKAKEMPKDFTEVKYSLCSISFHPETRTFGTVVDTLYNAGIQGNSVSFPRVSPDGNYLLYTLSSYGNFSIWHKDADLYMLNLTTGEHYPLEAANSEEVESYHSWSSNSKWVIFSSRRMDGLYTHPYITYINEEGKATKAVLLPQENPDFYPDCMKSFNIPEFIKGEIKSSGHSLVKAAKQSDGIQVTFHEKEQYPVSRSVADIVH
ncbi:MAG: hypothetical protein LUG98_15830 [Tannerellaceae bacterium]|nr:hypothetical protein [Tannerellaceae bacterium]